MKNRDYIFFYLIMKKVIVHLFENTKLTEKNFKNELNSFLKLNKKYNILNIIFFKGDLIEDNNYLKKYEEQGILTYDYCNKTDLSKKLIKINNDYCILHISTTSEFLINTVNNLLEIIGKKELINPKIFRDKYIQRDLLKANNLKLGVKFLRLAISELDFDLIKEKIGLPFILKPTNGVQSAGVMKIESKKNFDNYMSHFNILYENCSFRGFKSDIILAEEYIDGDLYSIDYFVSKDKELFISKPVKVKLGIDIGINDYFNFSRIVTSELDDYFKDKKLKNFIRDTIEATGIKATFVHHEFKINSKGELKTIELNGRIGGGRLELMNISYGINLYEYICKDYGEYINFIENVVVFHVFPFKKGILKAYNKGLFSEIEKRKSTYSIKIYDKNIGKEVGLTKDGFTKLSVIKIKNKNLEEFNKDLKFIEDNYKDLLILEED